MDDQARLDAIRTGKETAEAVAGKPDYSKPVAVFRVDVVEGASGRRYNGVFRSKAPTLRDRDEIGLLTASLASGMAYESLPPITRYRLERRATFAVCLVEKPDWFKDPGDFYEDDVPDAVYKHILEHINTFFRRGEVADSSAPQSDHGNGAASQDAGGTVQAAGLHER